MRILFRHDRPLAQRSELSVDKYGVVVRWGWFNILRIDCATQGMFYFRVMGVGATVQW